MPGPVSDIYDPEFGSGENADMVRTAIKGVRNKLAAPLPTDATDAVRYPLPDEYDDAVPAQALRNIVDVAKEGPVGRRHSVTLSENELRVVRFALNRALESI